MIRGIPETVVSSVGQFMSYLEEHCRQDEYLFRGQREDKPLAPKVARLTPRGGDVSAMERNMVADFKRQAHPWLELRPETAWDWLAIAQHHGLPTRLLDWSQNPLAALWFAVYRPAEGENPGVVWLLYHESIPQVDPALDLDPFQITETKTIRPNHIARRIISQSGLFTAHKADEQGRFLPLENDPSFTDCLMKVTIPASKFEQIRWDLDRYGFDAAYVYPGLDGLCQHLQWLHTLVSDEKGPSSPKRDA